MSNQICIKQQTFDQLLSLAFSNCDRNTNSGELKITLGGKITENYSVRDTIDNIFKPLPIVIQNSTKNAINIYSITSVSGNNNPILSPFLLESGKRFPDSKIPGTISEIPNGAVIGFDKGIKIGVNNYVKDVTEQTINKYYEKFPYKEYMKANYLFYQFKKLPLRFKFTTPYFDINDK